MVHRDSCIAGIGIILLAFWAVVFINAMRVNSEENSDSWRRRLQADSYQESSVKSNDKIILVLSTTLIPTEDEHTPVAELQRNTMHFLSTMPGVLGIVYCDDDYWFKECKKYSLQCIYDFPRSPFGMPFFFGMIDMAINKFPGYPFYGYINGDILVENTLSTVLEQVHKDILSGKLGPKVSLFTHRKNMFATFPDDLYTNRAESRDELFRIFNSRSVTYWDVAIDLFVFTPTVFPWRLMPNFVIGRTKYDNYIIQSLAHDPSQVMIDASNMVAIVHQTIDGVRSGLRKQRSEKKSSISMLWNEIVLHISGINNCCQDIWFAEFSSHVVGTASSPHSPLVPTTHGVCIEAKLSQSYLEDDFQFNEIELLETYIKPEAKRRCLFVVEGAVSGFMSHLCEHTYYLCTNRRQCIMARQRIASCGLQDKVTLICTEISRDRYMSQLTEYLGYYKAEFDTVISMLPSGDGLIQYIVLYQMQHVLKTGNVKLYFIRGFNRAQTRNSVLINTELDVVKILEYRYYFDGPHFPEIGMAVYCEKGKKGQLM